jgi:peptidyl-prolyl cis-trans isomerase C
MTKFPSLLLIILTTLFLAVCSQGIVLAEESQSQGPAATEALSAPGAEPGEKEAMAWVNGEPITRTIFSQYFFDRTKRLPGGDIPAKQYSQLLGQLVNSLILSQEAAKNGLDQKPSVTAKLELLRWEVLTQAAIQDYVRKTNPSDEELKALYAKKYSGPPALEYKARHILLKAEDEEQAKHLIQELDQGADFAELAKKNSTGPTASAGGDLGWFGPDSMVKPFTEAVQTLEKGGYSKAPVKTQFGWHVILLEESREIPHPDFEAVRKELVVSYQQQALKAHLKGLTEKADIKMNPKFVKKAESKESKAD